MAGSENSCSEDNISGSKEVKSKNHSQSQVQLSEDEEELVIRMYNLVGERWSLIAGRIPGRTADEIKNYWIFRDPASGLKKQKMHYQVIMDILPKDELQE